MMLMLFAALILVCTSFVFALPWLSRGAAFASHSQADLSVYADQMRSLDQDVTRGIVTPEEAQALRTEISRRILAAGKTPAPNSSQAPLHAAWTMAVVVAVFCGGSVGLYLWLGSPSQPDSPLAGRIAAIEQARDQRPSQAEAEALTIPTLPQPTQITPERLALVEELRRVVADRPGDVRGLRLLVQQEIRLGAYSAARSTQEALVAAQGDRVETEDLANLFDIMLYNTDDYISPQAEQVLAQLRAQAPVLLLGLFYQGMLEIQTGRLDLAFANWRDLLEQSPANAPWTSFVRGEMPGLAASAGVRYELPPVAEPPRGPTQPDIDAASDMTPEDRQAMIEDMVDQLSSRLATQGGTAQEWQQLIRAMTVLGRNDQARAIAGEALVVFSGNPAARDHLTALVAELGLE